MRSDDEMDALLHEEIPDGGFTLRVLASLPPRRPASRLRGAILLGSAVAACAIVLVALGGWAPLSAALAALWSAPASPAAAAGAAIAALATWAGTGLATSD